MHLDAVRHSGFTTSIIPRALNGWMLLTCALVALLNPDAALASQSAISKDQVLEGVRLSRSGMPAFHATATVTTRRDTAEGAPTVAPSVREETVVCDPRRAVRVERAVGSARQCMATNGVEHLRYAILDGVAGEGPEVTGSVSQDARTLRLEGERSTIDLLMDWPLVSEVLASANGAEPKNGLVAWLAQADVQVVDCETVVDGSQCVRLSRTAPGGGLRVEYTLDPACGWLPRRYQVFSGETLLLSREIHEIEAIGSGAFLPLRAVERNVAGGVTVEFAVARDADGRPNAGVVLDTTSIATAPSGAVLQAE
ncbi:MAG: hypothetical protein ACK5WD_05740 [bacterium]|jgi:hypothetical protein